MLSNPALALESSLRLQLPINRVSTFIGLEPRIYQFSVSEKKSYIEKNARRHRKFTLQIHKTGLWTIHN